MFELTDDLYMGREWSAPSELPVERYQNVRLADCPSVAADGPLLHTNQTYEYRSDRLLSVRYRSTAITSMFSGLLQMDGRDGLKEGGDASIAM